LSLTDFITGLLSLPESSQAAIGDWLNLGKGYEARFDKPDAHT